MELCSDNHPEIVFNGHNCPMCEAITEIDDLSNQVEKLERKLAELGD